MSALLGSCAADLHVSLVRRIAMRACYVDFVAFCSRNDGISRKHETQNNGTSLTDG